VPAPDFKSGVAGFQTRENASSCDDRALAVVRMPQADQSTRPEFRKRQIYGLLVVAVILLLAGLSRSLLRELFPPGWWRVW
jgi:hypothetical protein